MPHLNASGLWLVQERAIRNLEESLVAGRPRALVQMATESGKTFMACNQGYRLIKHAGARRVLFLVDRSNLGGQTLREFQGFTTPDEGRKFTELYNVRQYIEENRDEIAALQALYERPYRQRLTYADIKALADALVSSPRSWTTDRLWEAYRQMDRSKVRGSGQRTLADIVSVVRYAIGGCGRACALRRRRARALPRLAGNAGDGWPLLRRGAGALAGGHPTSRAVSAWRWATPTPFNQQGGLGKAYELFGDELPGLLEELNLELVT